MGVSERFGRGSVLRRKDSGASGADDSLPDAVTSAPVEPDPPMQTEATQPRRPAPTEPAHGQATWISITPASARRTTLMVIGFFIVLTIESLTAYTRSLVAIGVAQALGALVILVYVIVRWM